MSGTNGGSGDAEFDAFVSTGEVEGDFSGAGAAEPAAKEEPAAKPAARRGPPREAPAAKPAAAAPKAGEEEDDTGTEEGEEGEEEEGTEKPQKSAKDHQIERLKREKRDLQRQLRSGGNSALEQRLASLETRLTAGNGGDTKTAGETPAPDPTDTEKYPLGHLDDRYIEDKLDWLAEQKAAKQADTILKRNQETEQERQVREAQAELLGKVDDLATKGSELFEDFQESVVEAGMRGDWDLTQTTFEAAAEAENGPQILYDLANDPKEASRVAKLSPMQQLRYVLDKDAELGGGKAKPRTKPQAGDPPRNQTRGANSRVQGNPATDDLGDFEAQWERDAKRKK